MAFPAVSDAEAGNHSGKRQPHGAGRDFLRGSKKNVRVHDTAPGVGEIQNRQRKITRRHGRLLAPGAFCCSNLHPCNPGTGFAQLSRPRLCWADFVMNRAAGPCSDARVNRTIFFVSDTLCADRRYALFSPRANGLPPVPGGHPSGFDSGLQICFVCFRR